MAVRLAWLVVGTGVVDGVATPEVGKGVPLTVGAMVVAFTLFVMDTFPEPEDTPEVGNIVRDTLTVTLTLELDTPEVASGLYVVEGQELMEGEGEDDCPATHTSIKSWSSARGGKRGREVGIVIFSPQGRVCVGYLSCRLCRTP